MPTKAVSIIWPIALILAGMIGAYGWSHWTMRVAPPPASGELSNYFWYGATRAAGRSMLGLPLMNVCNSSDGRDVDCKDMISDATTGELSSKKIGGITCPGPNCTIKRFYGFGRAAPSLEQAVIAKRAVLVSNCETGRPCARFDEGQSYVADENKTIFLLGRPSSLTLVAERTGPVGELNPVISFGGIAYGLIGFGPPPDTVTTYSGMDVLSRQLKDNSLQAVSANLLHSIGTVNSIYIGTDALGNSFVGDFNEGGLFDQLNAIQAIAMCQNISNYYHLDKKC